MPQIKKKWLSDSIIYQLFVGRWSTASIKHHQTQVFSRLEQLNFSTLLDHHINCIYLLGVFDNRGPIIVTTEQDTDITTFPDRLPSIFAISDHQNTNPDLGSKNQLISLISNLQHQGFRVILDFVPNHTGTTHPWVTTHPEYYHHTTSGFVSEFSGDVYKLNYHDPLLRRHMISTLETIASWGADGVRVDMAHLVPADFWHQAISTLHHNYPDFIFIAEAYPQSPFDLSPLHHLLDVGFNAIYNSPFYHNLHHFFAGSPLDHLISHLNHTASSFGPFELINYISNHDDPAPSLTHKYLESLLAITLFSPSIPFIANGSLFNHPHRLAHHYYDHLLPHQTELNPLPTGIKNIFHFYNHFRPTITTISHHHNLITAQLTTNHKPATLFANLDSKDRAFDSSHKSPGHIHHKHPQDQLAVGQVELFLSQDSAVPRP